MGKLRLFALVVGVAACGNSNKGMVDAKIVIADTPPDQKVFMDAPPPQFDFSCIGNSEPAANANVTISGTVTEVGIMGMTPSFTMLAGATVDACTGNCQNTNKLGTATSDAQGAFSDGPYATGGAPINGYLHMTYMTDRPTFVYPPVPIVKDMAGVPVFTFTPGIISLLGLAGCTQNDTQNGLIAVVVTDCMGNNITDTANVTLSVKNGSTAVGDAPLDVGALAGAMAPPQAQGLFLVCNVPQATITIGAKYKTMTLLPHDVDVTKATTLATEVRPGY